MKKAFGIDLIRLHSWFTFFFDQVGIVEETGEKNKEGGIDSETQGKVVVGLLAHLELRIVIFAEQVTRFNF